MWQQQHVCMYSITFHNTAITANQEQSPRLESRSAGMLKMKVFEQS